jgi:radical SAM superfamily enzyme YgiQ (UPF0313 family)
VASENLLDQFEEHDAYLYSIHTLDAVEANTLVAGLRKKYKKACHIAGGPHVSLFPDLTGKVFDAIAIGESEQSIINIVNDLLAANLQPTYKQAELSDLNAYPYPDRKWIDRSQVAQDAILNKEYIDLKGTSVLLSRGCPFDCHFCSNLVAGNVRYRDAELIQEELEYLKRDYGVEALAIKDDNAIPVGKVFSRPYLEAIGSAGLKWRGQSRATGILPEMARLAKEAGCIEIAIGLDSVSAEARNAVNKQLNMEKAREYIALLQNIGIGVRLHFIIGFPNEPPDIAKQTMQFINEVDPNSVLLSILIPLPGTEMYRNPDAFGMTDLSTDFDKYKTAWAGFNEDERPEMVFRYKKQTPWGEGRSNDVIIDDYLTIQSELRTRRMKF